MKSNVPVPPPVDLQSPLPQRNQPQRDRQPISQLLDLQISQLLDPQIPLPQTNQPQRDRQPISQLLDQLVSAQKSKRKNVVLQLRVLILLQVTCLKLAVLQTDLGVPFTVKIQSEVSLNVYWAAARQPPRLQIRRLRIQQLLHQLLLTRPPPTQLRKSPLQQPQKKMTVLNM